MAKNRKKKSKKKQRSGGNGAAKNGKEDISISCEAQGAGGGNDGNTDRYAELIASEAEAVKNLLDAAKLGTDLLRGNCAAGALESALNIIWELSRHLESVQGEIFPRGGEFFEDTPTEATMDAFKAWLHDKGCEMSAVEPMLRSTVHGGGSGVVCSQHIKESRVAFRVPLRAMINPSTLRIARDDDPLLNNDMLSIVLALLQERAKGASSEFGPYIATLPRAHPSLPIFWSPSDLARVSPSQNYADFCRKYFQTAALYAALHSGSGRKVLPFAVDSAPSDTCPFTLQNFKWALAMAMSRQNNVPDARGADTLAFVPLFDLCNHEVGAQATHYDKGAQQLVCAAMRDYNEGEEFTMHYGPRPSFELVLYSGFALPEGANVNDSYALMLTLNPADPLIRIKKLIVRKRLCNKAECTVAGEGAGIFTKLIHSCSSLGMSFMQYARVAVMTKEECAECMRAPDVGDVAFVSKANETAALKYMRDIVCGAIETYSVNHAGNADCSAAAAAADQLLKNEVWMLKRARDHVDGALEAIEEGRQTFHP